MSKKEQIAFKCSECSELFPKELVDEILKGKTVLCERCGFPFRSSFTKKDYKEMGSPPIQAPKLKRKQTSAYNYPKNSQKYGRSQKKPKVQHAMKYRYEPPPTAKNRKPKGIVTVKTSGLKEKVPDSDIQNLKKAIRIMNDIVGSPLIIIIGILILAGSTPSAIIRLQSDIVAGVSQLVINVCRFVLIVLIWSINYRMVIKKVKNESYTNLGIDAIFLGFIGLPLYGLSTFILFEGIFILLYEIFIRHNNLIDLGKTDSLSEEILAANISESSIKVLNEFLVKGTVFLLAYSLIPILKKVRDFVLPATAQTISTLVFYGVFTGVAIAFVIYLKTKFVPSVKGKAYQEIPEDLLVRCIVFSSFSLFFAGVGTLGLILSIILFGYKRIYRSIKKQLPKIQYVKPKTSTEKPKSQREEVKSGAPFIPKTQEMTTKSGKDLEPVRTPPKSEKGLQSIPIIRVDDKEARNKLVSSLKQSEKEKPGTPPGKPPIMDKGNVKEYMDRVFTVLTADMRNRLLKLDIPEDQKWEVIREFVNLKKDQQQKYLVELEDINRVMSEELIKRVKKMKLPKKETNTIIKQLEIMDPKEQVQFVEFLEHSQ